MTGWKNAAMLTLALSLFCNAVLPSTADAEEVAGRVFFYRTSSLIENTETPDQSIAPNGDMIIIESDGHWGLIDAGFRFDPTITDRDGTTYLVPAVSIAADGTKKATGMSSQIEGMNGRDAASFLHDALGVDHLDFIIGTHGHSDHIGGIPDIANFSFTGPGGNEQWLVDESTVYLAKQYRHISSTEDDLGDEIKEDSWHNQAYVNCALAAMEKRGAQVIDVSNGLTSTQAASQVNDYQPILTRMKKNRHLTSIGFQQGDVSSVYDDHLSFAFGHLTLHLYNLYSVDGALHENVNSIATVITDKRSKILVSGDLDAEWFAEQRIAQAISDDFGKMDLIKANHHGCFGSNTRDMLDMLQPRFIVMSRCCYMAPNWHDPMAPAIYYANSQRRYTEAVFEAALSGRAIVASFDTDGIQCFNLLYENRSISLSDISLCQYRGQYPNGWYAWSIQYKTGPGTDYCFFSNKSPLTGWHRINASGQQTESDEGEWYYFDALGFMQTGWLFLGSDTYYLLPQKQDNHPLGSMAVGQQWIDDRLYVFGADGKLIP